MKVIESTIASQVKKVIKTQIGVLYFFNDIVISEFYEGVHVSYENSIEIINSIINYFGDSKPFGFVSNMINSYSIEPLDTLKFKDEISNMASYGVVSYNEAGKMNAMIENSFCKNQNICFYDLYDAANTIYSRVRQLTF